MTDYRDEKSSLQATVERLEGELEETKAKLAEATTKKAAKQECEMEAPAGRPGSSSKTSVLGILGVILTFVMMAAGPVVGVGVFICVQLEECERDRQTNAKEAQDAARQAREASMVRSVEATWNARVLRAEGTYVPSDTPCKLVVAARGNGREAETRSVRVVCGNLVWERSGSECALVERPGSAPRTFTYSVACTLEESGEHHAPRGGTVPAKAGIDVATVEGRLVVKTTAPSFLECAVDRESVPWTGDPLVDPQ